jgi:hypothetical protein
MAIERAMEPGGPALQPFGMPVGLPVSSPDTRVTPTEDGGVEVDFDPERLKEQERLEAPFGANLAEYMEDSDLQKIAIELVDAYLNDRESRSDWEKTYRDGLELLGLKYEERTEPWDGACGVFHPLLTESIVDFQSQTIMEVFPVSGPAKAKIEGAKTEDKIKQGHRVQDYMNYVATEEMVEYRTETERLLFALPIAGSAFRKVYHDPALQRQRCLYVPPEDLVVNYGADDLTTAERITHVMRRTKNWLDRQQAAGFYLDIELQAAPSYNVDEVKQKLEELSGQKEVRPADDVYNLLEMHVNYDLPGFEDKFALPYVITLDLDSGQILGIRRNWRENDAAFRKREHFVHYQYIPGLSFYAYGLAHLIGGLVRSSTSLLRQLVDAGTLANIPAGFKTRGLNIADDNKPIMPGEWRDADVPAGTLKENLLPLPYKEPSAVLYQLLGDLVETGRRFASAADLKASDMNNEAPVGSTLAILERALKTISAVQTRVHTAIGRELRILAELIGEYGPEQYPYASNDEQFSPRQDFDGRVDIIPVSDPNAGTMAQRILTAQAALQLAQTAPHLYDMRKLHRQMLTALGLQDVEDILPSEDDMGPMEPVAEDMSIITGKPVRAFQYQDHEAHIQVHMATLQNPEIVSLLEQSPQAPAIMAAMAAHIQEHVAMGYRQKIEEELGVHLPPPDQPLPEDIELRLSRLVAPAAAQLTGKAQQKAQAEENARQQEDPVIQAQQQKLENEKAEIERKTRADQARMMGDMLKAAQKAELDWARLGLQGKTQIGQLMAKFVEMGLSAEMGEREISSKEQMEGIRIGLEMAQKVMDQADQERQDVAA